MKLTTTLTIRSLFAAVCLAACSPSLGDMTDGSDDTGADPTGASNPTGTPTTTDGDVPGPCSSSNPCPDGQFCWNGLCALGCNSNEDCADDQFCATDTDRLCHNKEVTTCPDVPCEEGQVCVNGFCSTPPPDTQCTPSLTDDGCESNAVCLYSSEEEAKCYTLPYCAQDDTCPVGPEGAVCNTDILTAKDKICLIGLCTEASHCPADWKCVKDQPNAVIGYCSDGGPFAPCSSNEDCFSNVCNLPFPGEAGLCQ
ncbi:hypothetical protein [Nannocystis punicea]|uniref:Dickkopf N-terminal cysteine-rich domain-containing protein n=1 Tax=Nannocystis punicea TaxID=2995304 RepID=A0ABY7GYR9_9BACT|nr:hypothetical protein [Nannocystis poenicansa]WAS92127.1 hypothetical protein O0S08_38590 [Nannocystis poenicansa]